MKEVPACQSQTSLLSCLDNQKPARMCAFSRPRGFVLLTNILLYVFTPPLHKQEVNFLSGVYHVRIQSFFLRGWRAQSVLLFVHSGRENNWIHAFPKNLSTIWNANCLVRDLNSGCRVYLKWAPVVWCARYHEFASNIEQVLAPTPHKAPTIRPPASHHENYPS